MRDLFALLPADFRPLPAGLPAAASPEALEAINARALKTNPPGRLTPVGLVIVPAAFDDGSPAGLREAELPALVPRLRALTGLSIQGCLVRPALPGAGAAAVAACFHEVYQTAKRTSALLPCAMPWLGFDGLLAPLAACLEREPEAEPALRAAAETVAMQNRTAFYAKLYIR